MPRALWKGYISFGLVMIPVSLHSADLGTSDLHLDMLDSRNGAKVKYLRVNEKTGKEVPWESIVKGHKVDGRYVVLTPDDFKAAASKVARGIQITDFVPRDSVSPFYYEKPYYLSPAKGGERVYALLRETLKRTDRVGIANVVIQARPRLGALMVHDDVLAVVTLRFGDELRSVEEIDAPRTGAAGVKLNASELEMAEKLVEGMSSDFNPAKYHDDYRESLNAVIETRASGKSVGPIADEEPEVPANYNILDLLRRSVESQPRSAKTTKRRSSKSEHSASASRSRRATTRRKAG